MKEGGSITGLNTAATLWCSAAVGACAGAGEMLDAVFVTALLVGINLALRPLSRYLDRKSLVHVQSEIVYRIGATSPEASEHEAKDLLLRTIAQTPVLLRQFHVHPVSEAGTVLLEAIVESNRRDKAVVEKIAATLREYAAISAVQWSEAAFEGE